MKVIIVEDDPVIANDLKGQIETSFPDGILEVVGPVDNYGEAIASINSEYPDMAILDISLQEDKDAGIRIAHYINQCIHIPIIFLSGLPKNLGFDLAKFLVPFDFIHKPFDADHLAEKVEMAMIYQSQKIKWESTKVGIEQSQKKLIMVTTGYSELTAIPVEELILLEADDKILLAHTTKNERPIKFTSPGLKNFYLSNLFVMKNFHQLNRKYIINLEMVRMIRDNHIHLPKPPDKNGQTDFFKLSIPRYADSRRLLFARLGHKY